jgi:hypothetical protein
MLGPRNIKLCLLKENIMGLFEEVAGAVVAVEGLKKVDPNAGIFTEGIAAVAGFEGTEAIVDHFEKKEEDGQ